MLISLGLALVACQSKGGPTDVVATVSPDVDTVITVTWTTPVASTGHVAFGVDGALDRSTPDETSPSTQHKAVLVGLPPDRDVSWQIVCNGAPADVQTTTTGSLPDYLTAPVVTGTGNDLWLTTTMVGDSSDVVILLDPQGEITWWHQDTRGLSAFRALVTRDGTGIVYSSVNYNGGPSSDSAFIRVPWDGSTEDVTPVPDLAHDFVELPDQTLVSVDYVTQDQVLGSGLVALDRAGTVTSLWNAWQCLDPVANPSDDPAHGWTHANALDYLADDDAFLVGMRNLGTIEHVDRTTGDCAWGFGGSGGTVKVNGPEFIHEHQFELTSTSMIVFDNDGAAGDESRGIEYTFDPVAGKAKLLRTFTNDPPLYSFIMGDVHRTDNGDTLVLFSEPETIERYADDGSVNWKVEFGDNALLGFLQPLVDPYHVP